MRFLIAASLVLISSAAPLKRWLKKTASAEPKCKRRLARSPQLWNGCRKLADVELACHQIEQQLHIQPRDHHANHHRHPYHQIGRSMYAHELAGGGEMHQGDHSKGEA